MMNKKYLFTMPLFIFSLIIAGCGYVYEKSSGNGDVQSDICKEMKRQISFNARNNSADARYIASSQREALQDRYEEYGCQ